jgi:ADP-ribose pyrophosphatase YjhB (NUDIX family)
METFRCCKECCIIKIKPYIEKKSSIKKFNRKAGVLIKDPIKNKILLVQSRGNLWGPPKGSVKYEETEIACAIREVYEETGLIIFDKNFQMSTTINNKATYFYMEHDVCDVTIEDRIEDNDANGITWIDPDCLEDCIINGNITLNQHCRIILQRFINKDFSKQKFS